MRVLVTGANGFVGRWLTAELRERGHEVIGAGRTLHGGDVLPLDLADPLSVRGVVDVARADAVAHLAAQAFVPASLADPLQTCDINVAGTLRLIEAVRALREAGGPNARVLVSGSADIYGVQPSTAFPLRESVAPNPASPYAASKIAAEAFAIAAARSYALDIVVTRAFNHIGPGQDERFVVPAFAHQLARIAAGAPPLMLVGNLDARRDFLDVRDVVRAYALLLERRGDAGEVYNVCSGDAVSIKDVLRLLVLGARVGVEIRDDLERMRPADIPLLVGDSSKLRAATGWAPQVALATSLREIYADARERVAATA